MQLGPRLAQKCVRLTYVRCCSKYNRPREARVGLPIRCQVTPATGSRLAHDPGTESHRGRLGVGIGVTCICDGGTCMALVGVEHGTV